jgi:hypothetical protein
VAERVRTTRVVEQVCDIERPGHRGAVQVTQLLNVTERTVRELAICRGHIKGATLADFVAFGRVVDRPTWPRRRTDYTSHVRMPPDWTPPKD